MSLEFNIEIFDPRKEALQEVVASVKDITADPEKITKEELALVNETKNKLVKYRTSIQKIGKEAREEANKYAKDVIAYEKELIGIIEPEELRLKQIEKDAKDFAIRKVRMEKLPEMKARLASIGDDVNVDDETLLNMDPNEFDTYYNQRVADKFEADKAKAEAEKIAKEQEKARKKEIEEAKKKAAEDALRKEKERQEAEKLAEEQAKQERESDKKFQKFLAENGYTEENKDDFHILHIPKDAGKECIVLYKKIAVFNN